MLDGRRCRFDVGATDLCYLLLRGSSQVKAAPLRGELDCSCHWHSFIPSYGDDHIEVVGS